MQLKILFAIAFMATAKCSFAQDTTGGTRPQVILPLHRIKPKPKDIQTFNTETPKINSTGMPAQRPKHKRKAIPKS